MVRLLTCVSVVAACVCALPAFAGEAETAEYVGNCSDGKVLDDQEEPECCNPNLLMDAEDGLVCAELPSDMSVAVAITLILSFTFLISLQCFMNHHLIEMREYAYTVISSTVSIFTAVLTFQSLDGLVDDLISEPLEKRTELGRNAYIVVDLIFMLLWYTTTQITIAYVSCALKDEEWRKEELQDMKEHPAGHANMMLDIQINGVCFGMVTAHLTGFAAINFWTELQQIAPFNSSPLMTMTCLPTSVIAQLLLQRITDKCRATYISMHGEKDWFERMWIDRCQQAEDDIMGLTLSVIIVNSIRYAINVAYGHECLPNPEQKEEGPNCEFERSIPQALCLLGCGLIFVVILFFTKLIFVKFLIDEGVAAKEEAIAEAQRRCSVFAVLHDNDPDEEKSSFTQITERLQDVILTTFGMAYSWCIFHGTHRFLMVLNPTFLGQTSNATTLAVVLAFGATYIAFMLVRLLDFVLELPDHFHAKALDDSLRTVISAMSIFIGFAWEQTFEESVDQLAERTRIIGGSHSPAIAKVVIGTGCIAVVFCSWKWYILPFVFRKGWRYGYIFTRNDLVERCRELAEHDNHFTLSHLHDVAVRLAETEDAERAKRFQSAEDCSYKPLPRSEVEAIQKDNKAMKIHTRYLEFELASERKRANDLREALSDLEQQLLEERKAGEDTKLHVKYLERQLAQQRWASEDQKKHCEATDMQLVESRRALEDFKRRCETGLLDFLEQRFAEERQIKAEYDPGSIDDTAWGFRSVTPTASRSSSVERTPPEERKARDDFKRFGGYADEGDAEGSFAASERTSLTPPSDFAKFPSPPVEQSKPRGRRSTVVVSPEFDQASSIEQVLEESKARGRRSSGTTSSRWQPSASPSPSPSPSFAEEEIPARGRRASATTSLRWQPSASPSPSPSYAEEDNNARGRRSFRRSSEFTNIAFADEVNETQARSSHATAVFAEEENKARGRRSSLMTSSELVKPSEEPKKVKGRRSSLVKFPEYVGYAADEGAQHRSLLSDYSSSVSTSLGLEGSSRARGLRSLQPGEQAVPHLQSRVPSGLTTPVVEIATLGESRDPYESEADERYEERKKFRQSLQLKLTPVNSYGSLPQVYDISK